MFSSQVPRGDHRAQSGPGSPQSPLGTQQGSETPHLAKGLALGRCFSVFFSQKQESVSVPASFPSPTAQPATVTPCTASSRLRTEGISVPDIILPDSEDLDHPHFSTTGRGTQRHQRNVHESQQSRAHGMSVPLSGYRGNQTGGPMESSPNWPLPLPIHPTLMRIVDSASSMSSSKPSSHRTKEGIR